MRIRITVGEAMTLAAHLKLGYSISSAYKHTQVCIYNINNLLYKYVIFSRINIFIFVNKISLHIYIYIYK